MRAFRVWRTIRTCPCTVGPELRILLTGGSGQVGTEVRRRAGELDLWAPGRQELDLARPHTLRAALDERAPRLILSVGAYTAVDRAEDEPDLAYRVNGQAVAVLAGYARDRQIPLIHVSTDYVFDGDLGRPCTEMDEPNPGNVYGASKLAGEKAAASAAQHLILRTGWVFSAHGHNFVRSMLRLGAERETLRVVADQTGGPTWAGDVATALIAAVYRIRAGQSLPVGVRHLASTPHLNWHAFACEILQRAHRRGALARLPRIEAIGSADYPTRARRPRNTALATLQGAEQGADPQGLPARFDWRRGLDLVLDELACACTPAG